MTLKIKLNKIVFGLVLCIFLALFSFNKIITKAVDNNYSYDSYDEQLHFLYDNNISIPAGFSADSNFSIFLNNIFECLRNDINFNFCFNYSETIEFVDEIRNALKKMLLTIV